MRLLVIKKQHLFLAAAFVCIVAAVGLWLSNVSLYKPAASIESEKREIHLVTGEFSTTIEDGKKLEAYRWDPGTIIIEKNEKVDLIIHGINGMEHPFIIEGTDIEGVVQKGKETIVPLRFKKEGVYRLICTVHDANNSGAPMIAYIVVD